MKIIDPALKNVSLNHHAKISLYQLQHGLWVFAPIYIFIFAFVALLLLTEFNVTRHSYYTSQIDFFLLLNKWLSIFPSGFWLNVTYLGDAFILLPILALMIFKFPKAGLAILCSIPFAALLSYGGKYIAAIPRPAALIDNSKFVIIGDVLTGNNSLPSGHTIAIFTGIVALSVVILRSTKNLKHYILVFLLFGIAISVGVSRVAVGAHWPLDIFFGASFGWFAAIIGIFLADRSSNNKWINNVVPLFLMGSTFFIGGISLATRAAESPENIYMLWFSAGCAMLVALKLFNHALNKFRSN